LKLAAGPNLRELSISQLAELTGVKHETAIKRIRAKGIQPVREDGRAIFFDPVQALPVVLGVGSGSAEKARLDAANADLRQLELATKLGEVVLRADPAIAMVSLATLTASRIRGVGASIAVALAAENTPARCQELVDAANAEALRDLAAAGDAAASEVAERDTAGGVGRGKRARGDEAPAEAHRSRIRRAVSGGSTGNKPDGGDVEE
jgi:hypothetical protein